MWLTVGSVAFKPGPALVDPTQDDPLARAGLELEGVIGEAREEDALRDVLKLGQVDDGLSVARGRSSGADCARSQIEYCESSGSHRWSSSWMKCAD